MIQAVALLAMILTAAAASQAAELSFLRLRLAEGGLEILSHEVAQGSLKPEPKNGNIGFEIIDGLGQAVQAGVIRLPREVEYPSEDGTIGRVELQGTTREFTIRVPSVASAARLRLFRNAGPLSAFSAPEPLGEAPIPAVNSRIREQSQNAKLTTLLKNGPSANRLNFVVFGDGFQAGEEALFLAKANDLLNTFLKRAPYVSYSNYFNAYAIFVPSNESGSDHPSQGVLRDTYFNSSFETFGIDRLLTIPPNDRNSNYSEGAGRVFNLLARFVPDYDIVVMLVNDSVYGGSGGVPAIASLNGSSAEIALHELGHSFAALGDEYDSAANYPDNEEPNTTRETRRSFIKWNAWIETGTPIPTPRTAAYSRVVGLFEGAHYHATGWYRPKLDCMMRTLGAPFCEVCAEALVLSCYARVNLLESTSPALPIASSSAQAPARFSFTSLPPGGTTRFDWFADGQHLDTGGADLDLSQIFAAPGTHEIRLQAADETPRVRTDPASHLKESETWALTVLSNPTLVLQGTVAGNVVRFDSSLTATLVLEDTENFGDWTPLQTNTARTVSYTIPNPSERRFFRAKALPLF